MKRGKLISGSIGCLVLAGVITFGLTGSCGDSSKQLGATKSTSTPLVLAQTQAPAPAAAAGGQMTRFDARSGSKMRVEGTSSIHDWQLESTLIGGRLEVGPNFPTEPGQTVTPGKIEAKCEATVRATSLFSKTKSGAPYDDKMDAIVWEKLLSTNFSVIVYRLSEMTLKEAPASKDAPYVYDAKGTLAVAGVTNDIAMQVNVFPLGEKKLKITGTYPTKMSDFKIPAEKIGLGLIKTGDEVKVIFDWRLQQRAAPAAAK